MFIQVAGCRSVATLFTLATPASRVDPSLYFGRSFGHTLSGSLHFPRLRFHSLLRFLRSRPRILELDRHFLAEDSTRRQQK
jgi:hypothetical protein